MLHKVSNCFRQLFVQEVRNWFGALKVSIESSYVLQSFLFGGIKPGYKQCEALSNGVCHAATEKPLVNYIVDGLDADVAFAEILLPALNASCFGKICFVSKSK